MHGSVGPDRDHSNGDPHPVGVGRRTRQQNGVDAPASETPKPPAEGEWDSDALELPPSGAEGHPAVPGRHWYAPPTMAKAKRRKLRARRSKANHGRKPNAGRG